MFDGYPASQGLGTWFIQSKVTTYDIVDSVHKICRLLEYSNIYGMGYYNEQVRKVSCLLRAGVRAKKQTDLVELYADVGCNHGIPLYFNEDMSIFSVVCVNLLNTSVNI